MANLYQIQVLNQNQMSGEQDLRHHSLNIPLENSLQSYNASSIQQSAGQTLPQKSNNCEVEQLNVDQPQQSNQSQYPQQIYQDDNISLDHSQFQNILMNHDIVENSQEQLDISLFQYSLSDQQNSLSISQIINPSNQSSLQQNQRDQQSSTNDEDQILLNSTSTQGQELEVKTNFYAEIHDEEQQYQSQENGHLQGEIFNNNTEQDNNNLNEAGNQYCQYPSLTQQPIEQTCFNNIPQPSNNFESQSQINNKTHFEQNHQEVEQLNVDQSQLSNQLQSPQQISYEDDDNIQFQQSSGYNILENNLNSQEIQENYQNQSFLKDYQQKACNYYEQQNYSSLNQSNYHRQQSQSTILQNVQQPKISINQEDLTSYYNSTPGVKDILDVQIEEEKKVQYNFEDGQDDAQYDKTEQENNNQNEHFENRQQQYHPLPTQKQIAQPQCNNISQVKNDYHNYINFKDQVHRLDPIRQYQMQEEEQQLIEDQSQQLNQVQYEQQPNDQINQQYTQMFIIEDYKYNDQNNNPQQNFLSQRQTNNSSIQSSLLYNNQNDQQSFANYEGQTMHYNLNSMQQQQPEDKAMPTDIEEEEQQYKFKNIEQNYNKKLDFLYTKEGTKYYQRHACRVCIKAFANLGAIKNHVRFKHQSKDDQKKPIVQDFAMMNARSKGRPRKILPVECILEKDKQETFVKNRNFLIQKMIKKYKNKKIKINVI